MAGLSYSIVTNYLNRVVGRRKIGNNICFQGGTAFNKAVWAAFEIVTGKPIMVPDHHEVTGALGAASIAAEYMKKLALEKNQKVESRFKGFENLISVNYTVESFTCEHCPNHCEIKKVQMPGSEPLYYGSRCDRYNLKKKAEQKTAVHDEDAFEYRMKKLFECAGIDEKADSRGGAMPLYWYSACAGKLAAFAAVFAIFQSHLVSMLLFPGRTDQENNPDGRRMCYRSALFSGQGRLWACC